MITESILLKSCAMPPVSWPTASSRWSWRTCSSAAWRTAISCVSSRVRSATLSSSSAFKASNAAMCARVLRRALTSPSITATTNAPTAMNRNTAIQPPGHTSRNELVGSISQYQASNVDTVAQTVPGRRPPTSVAIMIAGKKLRKGKPWSAGPSAKRTPMPTKARTIAIEKAAMG